MKNNKEASLYTIDLGARVAAFYAILSDWLVYFLASSIALYWMRLTPSFTLHSTTSTVLNVTNGKTFTANLGVKFLAEDSNPFGNPIPYDSLDLSLFHHQEKLSTFSLLKPFYKEPAKDSTQEVFPLFLVQEAKFCNVSMMIDEWSIHGRGEPCGFVYLDLRFSANARLGEPIWLVMKHDKLEGHCGEVKVEMCPSSKSTVVVNSFLALCDVHSDLMTKVKFVLFGMLIFHLILAAAIPYIV